MEPYYQVPTKKRYSIIFACIYTYTHATIYMHLQMHTHLYTYTCTYIMYIHTNIH